MALGLEFGQDSAFDFEIQIAAADIGENVAEVNVLPTGIADSFAHQRQRLRVTEVAFEMSGVNPMGSPKIGNPGGSDLHAIEHDFDVLLGGLELARPIALTDAAMAFNAGGA
jgi:hypothetical protein